MSWQPWNDYAGLTLDRLLCVGEIIRGARDAAVDDHRPDKHESNWSLGVRCYERTCGALTTAAQEHEWLNIPAGIGAGPVHFVMSIGGHAVRFYRGSPDDAPERYRHPSFPELLEHQYALELDNELPLDRSLRIAIENDEDGRPESLYVVELSATTGITTNTFLIPLTDTVELFGVPNEPSVNIPPVLAEAVDDQQDADGTTGTNAGSDNE